MHRDFWMRLEPPLHHSKKFSISLPKGYLPTAPLSPIQSTLNHLVLFLDLPLPDTSIVFWFSCSHNECLILNFKLHIVSHLYLHVIIFKVVEMISCVLIYSCLIFPIISHQIGSSVFESALIEYSGLCIFIQSNLLLHLSSWLRFSGLTYFFIEV